MPEAECLTCPGLVRRCQGRCVFGATAGSTESLWTSPPTTRPKQQATVESYYEQMPAPSKSCWTRLKAFAISVSPFALVHTYLVSDSFTKGRHTCMARKGANRAQRKSEHKG